MNMKLRTLALTLGLLAGLSVNAIAQGQSGKVMATGWRFCVDFEQKDVALTVKVDAADPVPAVGVVWEGTAAPYTANLSLAQMPAAARAIGVHTVVITAPPVTVQMADNSTQTIPGGSVSVTYEVISPNGPNPTNPRWIRIVAPIK